MELSVEWILRDVDWPMFEDRVAAVLRLATSDYSTMFQAGQVEPVFQVSVWTDAVAATSAVSLATRSHAELEIERQASRFRGYGLLAAANEVENLGYLSNPADFDYQRFRETEHPELPVLTSPALADSPLLRAVEQRITESLARVVFSRQRHILLELPREPVIWVGVSTPDEWYGDVRQL